MATNFRVKIGKIGLFTLIRRPCIPKWIAGLQHRHSNFNSSSRMISLYIM